MPCFRVIRMSGVRVVDQSVLPESATGGVSTTTLVVASRAYRLIKEDHRLRCWTSKSYQWRVLSETRRPAGGLLLQHCSIWINSSMFCVAWSGSKKSIRMFCVVYRNLLSRLVAEFSTAFRQHDFNHMNYSRATTVLNGQWILNLEYKRVEHSKNMHDKKSKHQSEKNRQNTTKSQRMRLKLEYQR
jgi:hypothetical protein